jgi:membrane associated rhomboid family serine protease
MARGSPTLTTIVLFVAVFALEAIGGLVGLWGPLFVLAPPLSTNPWTIVTSVYAHAGVGHLVTNSVALLLPGLLVERQTTALRYHGFFLASGATAGVAQITVTGLLGDPSGVLGASGAVFAVIGYVLAANRLSAAVADVVTVSRRVTLALFAVIAVAVTVATGAPGVALIAHGIGLLLGLLAGRARVLRPN